MKTIYVIIASQEYDSANHQGLWNAIAAKSENKVIVVNIPADHVISRLKGKRHRIIDAKKPPRIISNNLSVVRPLLVLRPELVPDFGRKLIVKQFWNAVVHSEPDIMQCQVYLIVYNAFWVKILEGTHPNMHIGYFLFDEVRLDGDKIHKKQYRDDDYACSHSDVIFTMTQVLADSRKDYNKKTIVVGNGASFKNLPQSNLHIKKSVAFVGNFRDWIDKDLLECLVSSMKDFLFVFVGPVEANMKDYMGNLLNRYSNTIYKGKVSKDRVGEIYQMFDVVIVPYVQNKFTQATRPIKIVEAVISGTPVVTIPMDGYEQNRFIRFAKDFNSFGQQIRDLYETPIDKNSEEYKLFVLDNSWDKKASLIDDSFLSIRRTNQ